MKKKAIYIECEVPTSYQANSIQTLMGTFDKKANGSLYARIDFDTIAKAKKYLKERAELIYSKSEMNDALGADYLEFDAATAYIRLSK